MANCVHILLTQLLETKGDVFYIFSESREKISAAIGKRAGDMYTHAKLAILSVQLYSTTDKKSESELRVQCQARALR